MNEEKAKLLREWMAHEGRKRGRCGVGPTEDEVARVLAELGDAAVEDLADYAQPKLHFMHRYAWLLPFARHCREHGGVRLVAEGNGKGDSQELVTDERGNLVLRQIIAEEVESA